MKFNQLNLSQDLLKAIADKGFDQTTPIQAETIPLLLEGKNLIGQAQTGTGKTAAFSLPILENIQLDQKSVQAIVVTPTRELANQVSGEMKSFSKYKKVKVVSIFGGMSLSQQIKDINSGAQILVCTPGRLIDLLDRKKINTENVTRLVLDEADEMLNMGFIDDIKTIINRLPNREQTVLFSATMSKEIEAISTSFIQDAHRVTISSASVSAKDVKQYYTKIKDAEKFETLIRFMEMMQPDSALLFVRTKKRVDEVVSGLKQMGYHAEGIHSDFSQNQRMRVLANVKAGSTKLLVGTDVAARGLDVEHISHVFNYDVPQDAESYIHRIGRTGRAGKSGTAITFIEPREQDYLKLIEKAINQQLSPLKPPTDRDLQYQKLDAAYQKIERTLSQVDLSQFYPAADDVLEHYKDRSLVAMLIHELTESDVSSKDVRISPQRPLPKTNKGNKRKSSSGNKRGSRGRPHHGRPRGKRTQQNRQKNNSKSSKKRSNRR